jgi:LysM repeat protein
MRTVINFAFVIWFTGFPLKAFEQADCFLHVVQPGETLYGLAVKYKIKASQILAVNSELIKNPNIRIGQKICIPKSLATIPKGTKEISQKELQEPTKQKIVNPLKEGDEWFHVVMQGEGFYNICKTYQILAYDLISTNNLPNTLLTENQKLKLPKNAVIPSNDTITLSSPLPVVASSAADTAARVSKTENTSVNSTHNVEIYVVKKGDSYIKLTRQFGLKPDDLKKWNNLTSTDLKYGQKLKILHRGNNAENKPVSTAEAEKIPADATVIELAKEIAKKDTINSQKEMEVSDKILSQKNNRTTEKPSKSKSTVNRLEEEQARLDLLRASGIAVEKKAPKSPKNTQEYPYVTFDSLFSYQSSNTIVPPDISTNKRAEPQLFEESKNEDDISAKEFPVTEMKKDVVPPKIVPQVVLSFEEEYAQIFNNRGRGQNLKLKKWRGVGELSDAITGNEYLAYTNHFEPGSILRITNLMSKRITYVKVLGKTSGDSFLVISSKLAAKLGVIENDFLVEVAAFAKN